MCSCEFSKCLFKLGFSSSHGRYYVHQRQYIEKTFSYYIKKRLKNYLPKAKKSNTSSRPIQQFGFMTDRFAVNNKIRVPQKQLRQEE